MAHVILCKEIWILTNLPCIGILNPSLPTQPISWDMEVHVKWIIVSSLWLCSQGVYLEEDVNREMTQICESAHVFSWKLFPRVNTSEVYWLLGLNICNASITVICGYYCKRTFPPYLSPIMYVFWNRVCTGRWNSSSQFQNNLCPIMSKTSFSYLLSDCH